MQSDDSAIPASDPFMLFEVWYAEAKEAETNDPNAMALATASEDGFQPMPSVTIRPADDSHLPSANTCISRLYVPLYSSKAILKAKLLMAIKTKNFGFV